MGTALTHDAPPPLMSRRAASADRSDDFVFADLARAAADASERVDELCARWTRLGDE